MFKYIDRADSEI